MEPHEDETWSDAGMMPIGKQVNDLIVIGFEEQSAIWKFIDSETDDEFNAPVLLLDIYRKGAYVVRVALTPSAVASLNHIIADHLGRLWGSVGEVVHDMSDEAMEHLIADITGKGGSDE